MILTDVYQLYSSPLIYAEMSSRNKYLTSLIFRRVRVRRSNPTWIPISKFKHLLCTFVADPNAIHIYLMAFGIDEKSLHKGPHQPITLISELYMYVMLLFSRVCAPLQLWQFAKNKVAVSWRVLCYYSLANEICVIASKVYVRTLPPLWLLRLFTLCFTLLILWSYLCYCYDFSRRNWNNAEFSLLRKNDQVQFLFQLRFLKIYVSIGRWNFMKEIFMQIWTLRKIALKMAPTTLFTYIHRYITQILRISEKTSSESLKLMKIYRMKVT